MSLIIRQKRGALQLSINAIVVLILAITMLGLGLNFMKDMFTGTTKQFKTISQDLENQMRDQLKASNDRVSLTTDTFKQPRSVAEDYFFGIKNVENNAVTFDITINCSDAISDLVTPDNMDENIEFTTFENMEVDGNDVAIVPFKIKTFSGSTPTTYSCTIFTHNSLDDKLYGKKKFYVVVG